MLVVAMFHTKNIVSMFPLCLAWVKEVPPVVAIFPTRFVVSGNGITIGNLGTGKAYLVAEAEHSAGCNSHKVAFDIFFSSQAFSDINIWVSSNQ